MNLSYKGYSLNNNVDLYELQLPNAVLNNSNAKVWLSSDCGLFKCRYVKLLIQVHILLYD